MGAGRLLPCVGAPGCQCPQCQLPCNIGAARALVLATGVVRNRPPAPLRSRSAGPPPAHNPPRSRRSARHAALQAPGLAQAQVGSKHAAVPHGPPVPAVPSRTWTPVNQHAAEGELEERTSGFACGAETVQGRALRQQALRQQATAPLAGSKRAAARRGGRAVAGWWVVGVGGGGRTKAEARWARRWKRICETAVRARREQGRGWCAPCGAR